VAIPAVDQNPGEGCENQRRNLTEESNDAEQKDGTSESVYQPAGCDPRYPGADERDRLSTEEEAVVPVLEGPREMQLFSRLLARRLRGIRHNWRERNNGAIYVS